MADDAVQSDLATRRMWGRRLLALAKAVVPTVLIFLAVGPLAGYFAIMVPVALTAIEGPLGPIKGLLSTLAFLPLGSLFAYMMGYVPAIVTGVAVAVADCLVDLGAYRTPFAIVIGASITVALLYGVSGMENQAEPVGYWGAGAVAGAVGAIAGGVCAMVARRRAPVWPAA